MEKNFDNTNDEKTDKKLIISDIRLSYLTEEELKIIELMKRENLLQVKKQQIMQ